MQRLKEADLYKGELIPISGKLVERYNKCLTKLGFTETKLTSFFIDGIGWSPEVAEEKGEIHYLNHGDANPHCIVITPLQKGLPIYNPFHSFDKELMKLVFKKHQQQIENITRDSAICVDFDQDIDVFYEPLDVLKYKNITVKFRLVDDLDKAKEEQLQLIELFRKDNNFIDETIHQQLLDSANTYGDLREREVRLENIIYETESFYTEAFGGIYVLKSFLSPILVFEDMEVYREVINDTSNDVFMYHISHEELIERLTSHLMIECDVDSEITLQRYDRIKKFVLSEYIDSETHSVKDVLNDSMLFKGYLNKIDITARKRVMGLDRYLEKKKSDPKTKVSDFVDRDILVALHSPHSSLGPNEQDLVWKLLVSISPKDVLFLYWYDKEIFYNLYQTWNSSLKDWVIETIKKNI
ncbi:hypothetical protein EV195_102274 [Tenacibaculum skagerrakense]|uniref:Uncharacterized protein n=1 Tax=Tenacibaculum skagerrakense TaxID=186571 RepID=A0A4R2NXY7_9FLAO|nr:DUF6638 family protein [Tenacibaculum skagerrakense]TCP26932.1 hypothetical protein EV195_102274 [Tenacibaculum skagerrakense]